MFADMDIVSLSSPGYSMGSGDCLIEALIRSIDNGKAAQVPGSGGMAGRADIAFKKKIV